MPTFVACVLGELRAPRGVRSIAASALRLPSMSCWGTGRRTGAPLLPQGHDVRERHHCGPVLYIGKTPVEIVSKFKDEANFPWYMIPMRLRNQRFEQLWQLAHKIGRRDALGAVRVLTDPVHDRRQQQASSTVGTVAGRVRSAVAS